MELWGIGVDLEGCLQAHNILGQKLRHLEKEAYRLAGITFSLYAAADIANVLYGHLKLPVPEVLGKGKQHPSTDKHCLDLLRYYREQKIKFDLFHIYLILNLCGYYILLCLRLV